MESVNRFLVDTKGFFQLAYFPRQADDPKLPKVLFLIEGLS